jgi:hypothetical protein
MEKQPLKTDILKDTMPSCVSFNAKKALQVGDTSYNKLRRDKLNAMKTGLMKVTYSSSLNEQWEQIKCIQVPILAKI